MKKLDYNQLKIISSKFKNQNKKIILATGVFDILHQAHLNFLKKAKAQGDILFVGLESDERVKQMKGIGRPINKLEIRLKNLEPYDFIDYLFTLPSKFDIFAQNDLIKQLRPDILAVSSHTLFLDTKKEIIEKYGGKLTIVLKHDPKISTSKIIEGKSRS